jgi:NTE family protein
VLSGGGNLGALQVGMIRALVEHGIEPDLLVGCSVGAINGAGFADDPTPEGIAHMEKVWRGLDGENLMPSGWLPNAVALARRGEAIHDHQGLRTMAEDSLRSTTFEELQVPFQCVATDVAGVREVWFSSGPLVRALLASSALPAVYPAVEIDGVRYLDGGIVDDVPVSRAVELGATRIYVLQVGSFTRPRPEPRRPLDVAVQSYWIARHYRFKRDLRAMPPGVELHVLPGGDRPKMRFNDFTHTGTLIDVAYAASSAYLAEREAGVPIPSIDEALSQVESSYPADDGADELEGAAITTDPADSRWRRTVAAARRRDRSAPAVAGPGDAHAAEVHDADVPESGTDDAMGGADREADRDAGGGMRTATEPGPEADAPREAASTSSDGAGPRRKRSLPSPRRRDHEATAGTGDAAVALADPRGGEQQAALDASRWRRAVGIARRDRHTPGAGTDAEAGDPGAEAPLAGTSGLGAAQAVGARVAKILSRGEPE